MVNNWEKLTSGAWFRLSNNEDYLMQNRSEFDVLVKASDAEPTDSTGCFVLPVNGLINSTILPGVIWVKAANEDALIVYAK